MPCIFGAIICTTGARCLGVLMINYLYFVTRELVNLQKSVRFV
jgi:hypothetical protein